MKTGRNDPCPCGSRKKHKKCCMEKEEKNLNAQYKDMFQDSRSVFKDEWEPEDEPFFETEEVYPDDDDDDDDDDNEWLKSLDEESYLPEISEEETKLIDDWWEKYKKLNDTVTEREHLISFIEKYPHLADHLELYHEVLFDMGADHFRQGIYGIFVGLLLRIRKEYPRTYMQSYGFYDFDVICWLVAQGRLEDIGDFFEFFKQDVKKDYYDKIEDLISFFLTINRSDILLTALEHSAYHEDIIQIIVNRIVSGYLDKPVSQESVSSLIDELLSNGVELRSKDNEKNWSEKLLRYVRPFTQWDDNLPMKRSDAMKKYLEITDNFAYFLYQKSGLSFESAEFYSDTIYRYYLNVVSHKKRPDNLFCLDRETVKDNSYLNTFGWLDSDIKYIAQLTAFYCYAAYLRTCGNITEEDKLEFREHIKEAYRNFYSTVEKDGPEMLSFNQFPLWDIKS